MIYAYDQNIQMPVKDLYDTQMMAIAINAAKDMYDNAKQEIKDFNKLYGDFITPIAKDQEWYNDHVINKFLNELNDMYAKGIDPLRSAEGRSRIAMLINRLPIGDINNRRLAASNAEQYLKNKAELEAKGLYDPDLEERFLKYNLSNWDTGVNGVWNRLSPIQAKGLKELTSDWFDKRTAHDLTPEEVAAFGEKYDPMYKYQGFTDADLMNIASQRMPGFNGTVWSNYYRDIARRELQASGVENPTQEQVEARLQRDIANANQEYLIKPVKTADQYKLKEFEGAIDLKNRLAAVNRQHELSTQDQNNVVRQFSLRIQSQIDRQYDNAVKDFAADHTTIRDYAIASRAFAQKKESSGKILKYGTGFWNKLISKIDSGSVTKDDLVAYGLLNKDGDPTNKLVDFAGGRFIKSKNAERYWNSRAYVPASDYEREVTRNLFAGSDRTETLNGGTYNTISMGNRGVHYAPVRQNGIVNNSRALKLIQNEFDSYLGQSGILGYVDNSPVRLANIPTKNGDNLTDLYGNVLISSNDFENFLDIYINRIGKSRYSSDEKKKEQDKYYAKELGLVSRNLVNEDGDSSTYYIVPTIRTTRITPDDINQQYNHAVYGATSAGGERNFAENAGLEWLLFN